MRLIFSARRPRCCYSSLPRTPPHHAQTANPAAPAAAANSSARPAQTALPPGTLLAENAFKNVQVLKGISVSEFMATMGFFSASLSESCEYCHTLDNTGWAAYASDANPHKEMARKMVRMMFAINRDNFGGRRAITCFSCHNGGEQPRVTPTLALVYAGQAPDDPNEIAPAPRGRAKTPTADEIFDKYIQAIGGAAGVAALTSIVAKGSSVGYADENYKRPIDIFAKSPNERAQVIHTLARVITPRSTTGAKAGVPRRAPPCLCPCCRCWAPILKMPNSMPSFFFRPALSKY